MSLGIKMAAIIQQSTEVRNNVGQCIAAQPQGSVKKAQITTRATGQSAGLGFLLSFSHSRFSELLRSGMSFLMWPCMLVTQLCNIRLSLLAMCSGLCTRLQVLRTEAGCLNSSWPTCSFVLLTLAGQQFF